MAEIHVLMDRFITYTNGENQARIAHGGQKNLLHYIFFRNYFSVIKGNLVGLNCRWVNINPLHALIKFHTDLTTYNINHIWPDLVTEQTL